MTAAKTQWIMKTVGLTNLYILKMFWLQNGSQKMLLCRSYAFHRKQKTMDSLKVKDDQIWSKKTP